MLNGIFNQIRSVCYIVSVKVQFFCLLIGQNRVTCRYTKRHVRQPVRNETFIDRSIQYNTIQYNTIQYNTIQYNTIQYNTIQ
jgi:hypothetical protein